MTNESTTGTINIQSHLEMRKPIRLKSLSQKNPDEAKHTTKDSMRHLRMTPKQINKLDPIPVTTFGRVRQ
jgi:hypothetical protein